MVKALLGKFERSLDAKGRLLIPAKLLSGLEGNTLYVLRGFDGCISVYREEAFNHLLEDLSNMDYRNAEQRAYIRLAASSVVEMTIDSHGRILLGRALQKEYALCDSVTIIGCLDHFEIWDETMYARYVLSHGQAYDLAGAPKEGNRS